MEKAIKAVQMAPQVGNPLAESTAHLHAATALLGMGELASARLHAANGMQPAERSRHVLRVSWALQISEQVASAAGEWNTARGFSDRTMALDTPLVEWQLASRALLEYQTGDFARCDHFIEQLGESRNPDKPATARVDRLWLVDFARISRAAGHPDVVKEVAGEFLSSPGVSPYHIMGARVALALIAIQESDEALSTELYTALKPFHSTLDTDGLISLDRLLGLLAQTMGNPDAAGVHFEDAVAFCLKAGYRPELAWSYLDYATLRQIQSEREEAFRLLDEALAISTELGMRPLMDKANILREELEAQPISRPTYLDGLTEREVEVLSLVAAGKSNRDIGDELFISVNTVTRHISNIFSKTGASNRTEAARYANENDLS